MHIPRLAAVLLVLVFLLAGGGYVLLRDDSVDPAPKPAPAVVPPPKQVQDILTATAKQTRTKVTVRSGRSGSATHLTDTAADVGAHGLYDKTHYRYLQLGDDVYSYIDDRSCYLHAKQTKAEQARLANLWPTTSEFLPVGRRGRSLTYELSEAGGKTTVDWSYKPAGPTKPATSTGSVVADSDTHLMLSASGRTSVRGTAVISYGDAVALPGKPRNLCKPRG